MPKHCYVEKRFGAASKDIIQHANEIIADYMVQGYQLTLRQLYYQFVSRDLLANTVANYKRLGSIINDARLAGLIDWSAIEDRTRNLSRLSYWESPADIIHACSTQFRLDKWDTQPHRIEVWIEKEALAGVFERVCHEFDVPFLSCKGYTSQSEMWGASQRLIQHSCQGQDPVILHFGDHDPSGIDMTRDIVDRLGMFGVDLQLRRLALNMDQIEQYNPPPNPAKETDSRFVAYIQKYGSESWELDALEPQILAQIVRDEINNFMDMDAWGIKIGEEEEHKRMLNLLSSNWNEVTKHIRKKHK